MKAKFLQLNEPGYNRAREIVIVETAIGVLFRYMSNTAIRRARLVLDKLPEVAGDVYLKLFEAAQLVAWSEPRRRARGEING